MISTASRKIRASARVSVCCSLISTVGGVLRDLKANAAPCGFSLTPINPPQDRREL